MIMVASSPCEKNFVQGGSARARENNGGRVAAAAKNNN